MKRILIAIDDKSTAAIVADAGHLLAKAINGQTMLLHVIADSPFYSSLDYSPVMGFQGFSTAIDRVEYQDMERVAQIHLHKIKRRLKEEKITTLVKQGNIADTIVKTAVELDADMIVMGKNLKHGLQKWLNGSISEKVMRESRTPLLIVPTQSLNAEIGLARLQ